MNGLMFPKDTPYRNAEIRRAARDVDCTMVSPFCNHDPSTTVAAHSNALEHGRGAYHKTHDVYVAFICLGCHDFYDGRIGSSLNKEQRHEQYFLPAMHKTWLIIARKGIKL